MITKLKFILIGSLAAIFFIVPSVQALDTNALNTLIESNEDVEIRTILKVIGFTSDEINLVCLFADCDRLVNLSNSVSTNQDPFCGPFYRDLKIGMSGGDDINNLQTALIKEGYLIMPIGVSKGYFGNLTKTALQKWQVLNIMSPTENGVFGSQTRNAFKSRCDGDVNQSLPVIKITDPKEYENWKFGETQTVEWNGENILGDVLVYLQSSYGSCNIGAVGVDDKKFSFSLIENQICPGIQGGIVAGDYKIKLYVDDYRTDSNYLAEASTDFFIKID